MHFNCLPEYVVCVLICSLIPDGVGGRGGGGGGGRGGVVYLSQA